MSFTLNAGHNPDGKVACGAIGLIKESTEARKVVKEMKIMGEKLKETIYDTTIDNGANQNDVINKIISATKRYNADYHVSVHFNAGAKDEKGNGKTTGVEVLVYEASGLAYEKAKAVSEAVSKDLGLKNRGVKVRTNLGFLKHTKGPSLLIECCFVDDYDDCKAYNAKKMAAAIMRGLTGKSVSTTSTTSSNATSGNSSSTRKTYVAKIITDSLNVRKGPGTNHGVVATVKKGEAYTIVEESGDWGLLKSYQSNRNGWINLNSKYIEKK